MLMRSSVMAVAILLGYSVSSSQDFRPAHKVLNTKMVKNLITAQLHNSVLHSFTVFVTYFQQYIYNAFTNKSLNCLYTD